MKAQHRKLVYQALIVLVVLAAAGGIVDAGRLSDAVDAAQKLVAAVAGVLAIANLSPDE